MKIMIKGLQMGECRGLRRVGALVAIKLQFEISDFFLFDMFGSKDWLR